MQASFQPSTFPHRINGLNLLLTIGKEQSKLKLHAVCEDNPLIEWSLLSSLDDLIKSNPKLTVFDSIEELAVSLQELVEQKEFEVSEGDNGMSWSFNFKQIKKKIVFVLPKIEIADTQKAFRAIVGMIGRSAKSFYQDSEILKEDEFEMMQGWIGRKINLELIFRGIEKAFIAAEFHKSCDGKAPTLILAKSHFGKRFGGFTTVAWTSEGVWKNDPSAFLFSLDRKLKFEQKNKSDPKSIYCDPSYLSIFGAIHDLKFVNKCDSNSDSYCRFGHTYENYGFTNTVLAGSESFQVKAFEVYQISYV